MTVKPGIKLASLLQKRVLKVSNTLARNNTLDLLYCDVNSEHGKAL